MHPEQAAGVDSERTAPTRGRNTARAGVSSFIAQLASQSIGINRRIRQARARLGNVMDRLVRFEGRVVDRLPAQGGVIFPVQPANPER